MRTIVIHTYNQKEVPDNGMYDVYMYVPNHSCVKVLKIPCFDLRKKKPPKSLVKEKVYYVLYKIIARKTTD